eukprot:TRINITY_DN11069_c0_g2_i3.p1 TRINITY_DN11069_c0_g2~~TRINITY_DN11069_c0_g2_i3.p1  ORF type:complete len:116 (-),score=7.12 TRINITY_DN11069_c0_g2_i3:446-793(-)
MSVHPLSLILLLVLVYHYSVSVLLVVKKFPCVLSSARPKILPFTFFNPLVELPFVSFPVGEDFGAESVLHSASPLALIKPAVRVNEPSVPVLAPVHKLSPVHIQLCKYQSSFSIF